MMAGESVLRSVPIIGRHIGSMTSGWFACAHANCWQSSMIFLAPNSAGFIGAGSRLDSTEAAARWTPSILPVAAGVVRRDSDCGASRSSRSTPTISANA